MRWHREETRPYCTKRIRVVRAVFFLEAAHASEKDKELAELFVLFASHITARRY